MKFIFFVGTAGSGKSTLVGAYKQWLDDEGVDSAVVNLDPGADTLPYEADVDIREWISIDETMRDYNLGPNGAQIVAADLMAANIQKMTARIEPLGVDYVLVDTPGQLELFAFRESSQLIVRAFGKEDCMNVYLSDPSLCKTPNGFISAMVLGALVEFRLGLPTLNVLSKSDLLSEEEQQRMIDWFQVSDALYGDLLDSDSQPETVVGIELFKAIENVGVFGEMRAISAETGDGLEEIYAASQLYFFGGDDIGDRPERRSLGQLVHHPLHELLALRGSGIGVEVATRMQSGVSLPQVVCEHAFPLVGPYGSDACDKHHGDGHMVHIFGGIVAQSPHELPVA